MNTLIFLPLSVLIVFCSSAHAVNRCDGEALQKSRIESKKLYDQKKYAEAVKTLKIGLEGCYGRLGDADVEYCWAQSDLALALLKSGNPRECRDRLASQVVPNANCPCCGASEDDGKNATAAEKAALHNYELCEAAISQDLTKFNTTACPLKLPPRSLSSALIPADTSTKDVTECLVLIGTEYGKDFYLEPQSKLAAQFAKNPRLFCSEVVRLTRKSGDSKDIQTKALSLSSNDEVLGDSAYCCKLDRLRVTKDKGQILVLVDSTEGPSQPCGGSGTARATGEGLYLLESDNLKLNKKMGWGTH